VRNRLPDENVGVRHGAAILLRAPTKSTNRSDLATN
jgi:hypothetical protein